MKYTLKDLGLKLQILNSKFKNNPNEYIISHYSGKYALKSMDKDSLVTVSISKYLKTRELYHILDTIINLINDCDFTLVEFNI